jgi:hypothetical protein
MNGHGTITWVDGNKYEIEWQDGEMNGHGTFNSADGNMKENRKMVKNMVIELIIQKLLLIIK